MPLRRAALTSIAATRRVTSVLAQLQMCQLVAHSARRGAAHATGTMQQPARRAHADPSTLSDVTQRRSSAPARHTHANWTAPNPAGSPGSPTLLVSLLRQVVRFLGVAPTRASREPRDVPERGALNRTVSALREKPDPNQQKTFSGACMNKSKLDLIYWPEGVNLRRP